MTKRLREHPDDLSALVTQTAAALGIIPAYVEKDFWVTEVLRAACPSRAIALPDGSRGEVTFVFKGGTSLSRVFHLIERFSEDVDLLAVFPEGPGQNARHGVLKKVDQVVTAHLSIPGVVGPSDTGVKRYTTYTYPVTPGSDGVKQSVLLELGSRGGAQPASTHAFRSMVAEHAWSAYGHDASVWEELAPFDVLVLAPERTLLEKIAGVHAAASVNDTVALARAGRHFYDIGMLLSDTEIQGALGRLGPMGVAQLVDDINIHSEAAGFAWSPRPPGGFADSPAFDHSDPSHNAIRRGYVAALDLVHGPKPTLDEVLAVVHGNRELL
jgi:hypothetical protein